MNSSVPLIVLSIKYGGGGGGIIVDVPYVVGCSLLFAIKKNGEKSPKNVHYHTKDLSCEDFFKCFWKKSWKCAHHSCIYLIKNTVQH